MRQSLLAFLPTILAAPALLYTQNSKPVYWLLAGDSTTAHDGGWGDAFLSTTVAPGSSGHNWGKSGATTKSFRDQGYWNEVISGIGQNKGKYRVYVTIQFGHNDQKPTSNVSLKQYTTNLGVMADEVKSAGATPILVTPLTRRTFGNGSVIENLANETAITNRVAKEKGLHHIDLNKASTAFVNAIGQSAADKYNWGPGDRTHLNKWAEVVFSRIVSDLLVEAYGAEFEAVTIKNETLSKGIKAGEAV
ncbi:SGNH hydrolase-type esterase domain-containing protein [Phaeosphaeria sp. MPI-PUGE-AT-0046c]|nr:SGNH hydrolase-type esterase domain-containing protein [Phaeosphaeria sp. MPI-PUGE-AT-0046c]